MFEKSLKKRKKITKQKFKLPKFRLFSFKYLSHKRNHKKLYILAIFIGALILFLSSIFIFKQNDIFSIKKVNCTIEQKPCTKAYLSLTDQLLGVNLIQFDQLQYERNIINLNPLVKQIIFSKKYPFTLSINFIHRKPVAVIVDTNQNAHFVDESGIVFLKASDPNLAHIFTNESFSVGEQAVSETLQKSINIINLMNDSFLPVKYIDAQQDQAALITELQSGVQVIFSLEKNVEKQVDALQLILQNSKIVEEDKQIKFVDLRYDTSIIK